MARRAGEVTRQQPHDDYDDRSEGDDPGSVEAKVVEAGGDQFR